MSEARYLRQDALQLGERVLSVQSLKKRDLHSVREVPIPLRLAAEFAVLDRDSSGLIWQERGQPVARITTYRWIKRMMAKADIHGAKACPKGLRHAYGTRAILAGVPLHILQGWMGHASMRTTAIYATVLGSEQLELADRMW